MTMTLEDTMDAVVLHEYGGPEQLKFETVPVPQLEPDEVLVRVAAIGINPIDWKLRSGEARERMPLTLPSILGRDVAGTVEAVGAEVQSFKVGDRVLGLVHHGYAQLVTSYGEDFARMPTGMSFDTAAALPLVMLTGEQLVREAARVQPGQTVLITGALGGVGRSAVHEALKAGYIVLAGVRTSQKTEAMALGVSGVVCIDDNHDLKRSAPYMVVADTVGMDIGKKLVLLMIQNGVFATVVGVPENANQRPDVRFRRVTAHPDSSTLFRMANDVQARELTIPVGQRFSLRDAADAQVAAQKGGVGKILLIP